MFQHLPELAIILVIGLIVFGPEKLPEMAATAGRMVREVREAMDTALNPEDNEVPEDFSTYYYEALARSGDEVPTAEEYQNFDGKIDFAEGQDGESVEMGAGNSAHSGTSSTDVDSEPPQTPHA